MSINYRGDVTAWIEERIASGEPVGPNYLGELEWPTKATYDAENDRTIVEFSLIAPKPVAAS